MACIIKKIKRGRPYYYAAESARVNGKPRIVWQKYLGTLDDIVERSEKESSSEAKEADIFEAGGIAAMLHIFERLNLISIIDELVPKRNQGPSVGQYIALAAINRVLDPCSKRQLPDWYDKSILTRLWKHPSDAFSSQRFWDHMDLITEEQIEEIQRRVALQMHKEFKINPQLLLYDTTNFFSFIATRNKRNSIARRGRNKRKRNDLRQVGLALLVSKDFQIPLFHRVYQGNLTDAGVFPQMAAEIKEDYNKVFGASTDTTLVFDKGNISADAMENLIVSKQHIVCAIPKNIVPELFSIPYEELKPTPGLMGTRTYSCPLKIWCKSFKAVLTFSESYYTSQLADLTEQLEKCTKKLYEYEETLSKHALKKGKKLTLNQVKTNVKEILSGMYLKDIVEVSIREENGVCRISFHTNLEKLHHLSMHELGRTLIITTRLKWSDDEIISAYRGQSNIEEAFKRMNNQEFLHWQPAYHWTDQKIKVHGLYCVLALLAASLAHKIASEHKIDTTLLDMLNELSNIREVALIYPEGSKKNQKNKIIISRMSPKQKALSEALEVGAILNR